MPYFHQNILFVAFLLVTLMAISDGQFFTKTGSKSIPRMGRRADNSLWSLIPRHSSYKNKLVETLIHKLNERNERNHSEFDNSKLNSMDKSDDQFEDLNDLDRDLNENDKSKRTPLRVEEDSDQRFDTNLEVRKLEKILSSFIDKTHNL